MPNEGEGEEDVFALRTLADVVDEERTVRAGSNSVGNEADVEEAGRKTPDHEVAGDVIGSTSCDRKLLSLALEEDHEIGDTAVVDVGVGREMAPIGGIASGRFLFVLVDEHLEIDLHLAQGADDDVGADAPIQRHVAAGVGDLHISGIVAGGDADLGEGGLHEGLAPGSDAIRRSGVDLRGEKPGEDGDQSQEREAKAFAESKCVHGRRVG